MFVNNRKSTSEIFRLLCIGAIIITVLLAAYYLVFVNNSENIKEPSEFMSAEDCLNDRINLYLDIYPDEKERYSYDTKIYFYENEDQYIEMFNSPDTTVWFYVIDKVNYNGRIMYKYNYSETIMLNDKWQNIDNYRFRVVDSELELYNNDTVSQTKINFWQYGKKYTKYLLFDTA